MRLSRTGLIAIATAALLMGTVGCQIDAAIRKAAVIGRGSKEPEPAPAPPVNLNVGEEPPVVVTPGGTGVVRGVINFRGKAPARVKIDTSMDPACGLGKAPAFYSEQYVVNAGKLGNVFVYVKTGPPGIEKATAAAQTVVMDQRHCQYVPHVVGVVRGGYVQFVNSDVTMHNIHTMPTVVGNETLDVSQGPKGAPQVKQFNAAESMIPVRCNNHPWMNAFVNVAPTPYFAVSDATGAFEIKGLPAGTYQITAVHEKLGEQTVTLTVAGMGVTKLDFAFESK